MDRGGAGDQSPTGQPSDIYQLVLEARACGRIRLSAAHPGGVAGRGQAGFGLPSCAVGTLCAAAVRRSPRAAGGPPGEFRPSPGLCVPMPPIAPPSRLHRHCTWMAIRSLNALGYGGNAPSLSASDDRSRPITRYSSRASSLIRSRHFEIMVFHCAIDSCSLCCSR